MFDRVSNITYLLYGIIDFYSPGQRPAEDRSSPIFCDSVQVENNRARLAGSSYRFGNLSWGGIEKPFRLLFRTPFSPGRCPGLLSCCTFGAQNLDPHVPAPFGLWPNSGPTQSSWPSWWMDLDFLTTEDTEHTEFFSGL